MELRHKHSQQVFETTHGELSLRRHSRLSQRNPHEAHHSEEALLTLIYWCKLAKPQELSSCSLVGFDDLDVVNPESREAEGAQAAQPAANDVSPFLSI